MLKNPSTKILSLLNCLLLCTNLNGQLHDHFLLFQGCICTLIYFLRSVLEQSNNYISITAINMIHKPECH